MNLALHTFGLIDSATGTVVQLSSSNGNLIVEGIGENLPYQLVTQLNIDSEVAPADGEDPVTVPAVSDVALSVATLKQGLGDYLVEYQFIGAFEVYATKTGVTTKDETLSGKMAYSGKKIVSLKLDGSNIVVDDYTNGNLVESDVQTKSTTLSGSSTDDTFTFTSSGTITGSDIQSKLVGTRILKVTKI